MRKSARDRKQRGRFRNALLTQQNSMTFPNSSKRFTEVDEPCSQSNCRI